MELRLKELSEQEFETLHGGVLRLLAEYGILFEHEGAQAMLAKAGNRVDDAGRAYLEPRFVESALSQIPADGFVMAGRDEVCTLHVAVDSLAFRPATGAPYVFDYRLKERRKATMDDVRELVTLTDALEGYDMVNAVVTPEDAPGGLENVHGFINSHRFSLKPSDVTVMNAREVAAIGEVCAAIRGSTQALREKPLTAVDVAMVSPLRCSEEQTEAMLECARRGLPIEVLTAPAMGLTGPVTIAGSAAVSLAEVVGAICLIYLIEPGLGIINTARIQPVDMRTGALNYGAPELGMASVLVGEYCARFNLPSNLYGFGSGAKTPYAQSAMERNFAGLLMALGHPHMLTGSGILDNGLLTSPEQLVIDDEAIRFIKRMRQPVVIDDDTLGFEALRHGMETMGSLLAERHTASHLRKGALVSANLGQWDSYSQWKEAGSPNLIDRAHEKVKDILATHTVRPFDAPTETAIQKIVSAMA